MTTTLRRRGRTVAALLLAAGATASGGMLLHHRAHAGTPVPPSSEFGLGPRASARGTFTATLTSARALRVGPLQTMQLLVTDRSGRPVGGATVSVDGGMPQHGHGLPTRPRATAGAEAGAYNVAGVRFNMGGWWVLRFAISSPAGTDSVTFNVQL